MDLVQSVALAGGMAWASGLRLYAVILSAGLLGRFGYLQLPESLKLLENPASSASLETCQSPRKARFSLM